jgi:hypothetical protein
MSAPLRGRGARNIGFFSGNVKRAFEGFSRIVVGSLVDLGDVGAWPSHLPRTTDEED